MSTSSSSFPTKCKKGEDTRIVEGQSCNRSLGDGWSKDDTYTDGYRCDENDPTTVKKDTICNSTAEMTAADVKRIRTSFETLQANCKDADQKDIDESEAKKKRTAAALGAGVGAVGTGLLAWGVTKSIQDAELDKAQQAAIQEFMDTVGSKIRCFIGAEEVGAYGDVIQTSME